MLGALDRLPVNHKSYGIFGLWNTVVRLAGSDSGGRASDDAGRDRDILKDPAADVDVVRREVIAVNL